jgi:glyoxylase-like metal-dependent hydrolase (beta-lactamase superfamily II)
VLVDTGAGACSARPWASSSGDLKAAGYQPEQVDEIYITHMHGDHVGGLVDDGKPCSRTPSCARQGGSRLLAEPGEHGQGPGRQEGHFKGAMAALNPYVKAGKFKTFEGDGELVPGVRAQAGTAIRRATRPMWSKAAARSWC